MIIKGRQVKVRWRKMDGVEDTKDEGRERERETRDEGIGRTEKDG